MSTLPNPGFAEILQLIGASRARALQAVNTSLIELYWQVGEVISRKIAEAAWGDGVVKQLAEHIARHHPGLRGFTQRNLFRMRQFHEGQAISVSTADTITLDAPPHHPRPE